MSGGLTAGIGCALVFSCVGAVYHLVWATRFQLVMGVLTLRFVDGANCRLLLLCRRMSNLSASVSYLFEAHPLVVQHLVPALLSLYSGTSASHASDGWHQWQTGFQH